MPLAPGTRIGPYEVTGALGAGGMGEVYRARDSRLNRDVAVKVLPEALATDSERLTRFTREAQTLASLNHPNIAGIYGIEERAIIMELVEGDDLSERISRGAMPVDEALAVARQIIDALEAAHDLGIVHRDLKPANIKVRHDGMVKVLDFGLAKALNADDAGSSADAAASPTLTARATRAGVIIGTAAYMSPEQARGRFVDKRTDVWAFGCVLYEMLAGTKAFHGEDATEIISAVVKSEPAWDALPATLPSNVRTIVMRCLAKDRKARLPDLSVVRYLLDGTIPSADPPRRSSRTWQAVAAVLALTTVAAAAAWYRGSLATPEVTRFALPAPETMTFTAGVRANAAAPAISPDGRTVAFTAQDTTGMRRLWVRSIDSLTAQPLPGTEGAAHPFWSPDSNVIGFAITGKLMKVAKTGGPVTTLCVVNSGITSRGGTWSRDGVIVFNNGPAALYRVSSSGGDPTVIGELPDGVTGRQFPAFLPDGRHFLYHTYGAAERGTVFVASLDSSVNTRVVSSNSGALYDQKSGNLLFVRQGTLFAQRFDLKTLAVTGEAFPVAEGVEFNAVPGSVAFSISETGVLAYGIGDDSGSGYQLTWVDRTGKVTGVVGPEAQYRGVSMSPDGSRVAAHRHDDEGGDIWVTDVSRNTTSRLTFDGIRDNASPVWSPDGTRVAFGSNRDAKNGISVKSANNTGEEERLFETGFAVVPYAWSADGRSILIGMLGPKTGTDLWWLPVSGERKPVPLVQSDASEADGQISPDGKWLAYVSDETGRTEIYVQPASGSRGKWVVSNGGGIGPRWRGDSRELFFVGGGKMQAVEVASEGAAFVAGAPVALFDYVGTGSLGHGLHFSYAVAKDGQRILISAPTRGGTVAQSPIVVVINWLDGIGK